MDKTPSKSQPVGSQEISGNTGLIPDVLNIPDKLYFKIGEVSAITGVEAHVLRYWESELKVIKPQRASSKQRLYRRTDIENILTIKKLLQEDGYTIPGARKFLSTRKKRTGQVAKQVQSQPGMHDFCKEMKAGLEEIRKMLEE